MSRDWNEVYHPQLKDPEPDEPCERCEGSGQLVCGECGGDGYGRLGFPCIVCKRAGLVDCPACVWGER